MTNHDKWIFRQNARRKMTFGVHESADKAFSKNGGESWLRFNSVDSAKASIKDNIKVLKLMRTKKYQKHLMKMRNEAFNFYKGLNHD